MGLMDHETGFNTSYGYGEDVIQGWGERFFFTFYTEFGVRDFELYAEMFILGVIFVTSLCSNIFVLVTVLMHPVLQTVTNYFLLNLTAADILFALGIPAIIIARVSTEWPLGNIFCKILPYSQFVCGFVLLWTLTLISMDRYYCLVVPPYRSKLTPNTATALTITTWLIACILYFPVALWFREQEVLENRTICTIVFPKVGGIISLSTSFTLGIVLLCCILPLSLLMFYYYSIFKSLVLTKRISQRSHTRHVRPVRMLCISVILVLSMWLPIFVVMSLIYIDGRRPTPDTHFFLRSHHFLWSLLLALLNTVVNPLLYGALTENFLVCLTKRNKLLASSSPSVAIIS